ncbi:MAG: hypothetical protein FH758_14305 [Firmicutes bacterium]|nr:hypothetical protein [Bacillota bacterium]
MNNNSFIKEIKLINRIMLVTISIIILAGTLYYGDSIEDWMGNFFILAVIFIAFVTKKKRIKRKEKELDERAQMITYYALSVGFYAMLSVVFWFYTKELVQYGEISTRTLMEFMAAMIGYVGSYYYLRKKM